MERGDDHVILGWNELWVVNSLQTQATKTGHEINEDSKSTNYI